MCPCGQLINDDDAAVVAADDGNPGEAGTEFDGCANGLPQFPQNFAVSIFWLRQTEQISICTLPKYDLRLGSG